LTARRNRAVHPKPRLGKRSPHWSSVRREHLKRDPACRACGGTETLQVHHIRPFHLHPELELDDSNLITLCEHPARDCHFTHGHFFDWHLFNPNVIADVDHFNRERLEAQKETP
jgi:5-methylcytosine-specific restriction enzyme A